MARTALRGCVLRAPRVALVHDYLNQKGGGAERVLTSLYELFPEADVYTSIYEPPNMPPAIRAMPIQTSFMQRLPGVLDHHRKYFPLYPLAFRSFNLSGYDLVITNTQGFANGVRTGTAKTICYCLTPMRWAWNTEEYVAREDLGRLAEAVLRPAMGLVRAHRAVESGHRKDAWQMVLENADGHDEQIVAAVVRAASLWRAYRDAVCDAAGISFRS